MRNNKVHLSSVYPDSDPCNEKLEKAKKMSSILRKFSLGGEEESAFTSVAVLYARKEMMKKEISSLLLFHPFTPFRRLWDAVIIVLVFYVSFSLPLTVVFISEPPGGLKVFDYIVDALFILDIVIVFRTAFFNEQGTLILDSKAIAFRYMFTVQQGVFWLDVVSILPFELMVAGRRDLRFINLLKCFRLLRLSKVSKFLQNLVYANLFRMSRLSLVVVLCSHWACCLWYQVVRDDESHWLEAKGVTHESPLGVRYTTALYSVVLMLVGGDVQPTTSTERVWATLILLTGAGITAFIFGNMAVLLSNFDHTQRRYREKIDMINQASYDLGLSSSLKEKILLYCDYMWHRQKDFEPGTRLLRDLTYGGLRTELLVFLRKDMVQRVPLFADSCEGFLVSVINKLQLEVYLSGHIVMHPGTLGRFMFFVGRGQLRVTKHGQKLLVLRAGSYFGDLALLLEHKDTVEYEVRATTLAELHTISKKDLNTLIEDFPMEGARMLSQAKKRQARQYWKQIQLHIRSRRGNWTDWEFQKTPINSMTPVVNARRLALKKISSKRDPIEHSAAIVAIQQRLSEVERKLDDLPSTIVELLRSQSQKPTLRTSPDITRH